MKKLLSIILALALLPVSAFAESGWLEPADENRIRLNDGTELYSGDYINSNNNGKLSEHYIVYEPGKGVAPLVSFGLDVAGAAGFPRIVEIEAEAGKTIVAGVNGDYFTMATGVAMGLIIKDGRVCSGERPGYESIGFKADGSIVIGNPQLSVSVGIDAKGLYLGNLCFNKTLSQSNGLVVFSPDFGADNSAGRHYSAVVRVTEGECLPGGEVTGVIESAGLRETAQLLEEGTLVLSAAENTPYLSVMNIMTSLQAGDEVRIGFGMNEEWLDVVNAVGAERRLVSSGEIFADILADPEDKTRAPRTAFGVREDGTAVIYTADGRDSSHSTGLLYSELAQRMLELGCVDAVNLDGGASTQLYAAYPGDPGIVQVNKSSGDTVRRCADYLTFVNTLPQTGELARLHIYPLSRIVMAGATIPLTLKGSDSGWYAVDVSDCIPVWSVSGASGEVGEKGFTAGKEAGTALVSAYCGDASGSVGIEVITRPDEVNVTYGDGSALPEKIVLYAGESAAFKASVTYNGAPLYSDENSFVWHTETALGTVENAVFTASEEIDLPVEGFITAVAGETARSIPVTVYKDEVPPVIRAEISGNLLMAEVTDVYDPKFGKKGVSVRLDGSPQPFEMTDAGGVYVNLPEADGRLHHLVIEAVDSTAHRSRLGLEILMPLPEGSEAAAETPELFADLPVTDAYLPYAEYLNRRGIMRGRQSGEIRMFDKDSTLTRQEFAIVLCNWLGIVPEDYENTVLNFTDTQKISSWALPQVRAIYSKGYMAGKAMSDGTVAFDPLGTITRQEVLTVLSRLLGDGYSPGELTCSDASAIAGWALLPVTLAVTNGVANPGSGALRPLDPVTRAEVGIMMISMD